MHPDEVAVPGKKMPNIVCGVLGLAFSLLCMDGQSRLRRLVVVDRKEEKPTDIVALSDVDIDELIPEIRRIFDGA